MVIFNSYVSFQESSTLKYFHYFSYEGYVTDVIVWKCWIPKGASPMSDRGRSKFKEHDAQGPQIHFDPVAFALKDLSRREKDHQPGPIWS